MAPPDPVAATAVAGRLGLPRRLVSLLEGEGLFNDVTAIVLYHVAIAAAVTGTFSWPGALTEFVLSAVVAVLVETEGGGPFPERAVIVFISFAVILVTLIVQGLTLPWLVTRLGVKGDTAAERELEKRLAVEAARAAKRRLRQIDEAEDLPEEVVELLTRRMMDLGLRISPEIADDERREAYEQRARRIKLVRRVQGEMLSAARQVVLEALRDPGADPAVVSRVLRRLDARSWR